MLWRCRSQSPLASQLHCRQSSAPRTASSSGKPSSICSKLVLRSSGQSLGMRAGGLTSTTPALMSMNTGGTSAMRRTPGVDVGLGRQRLDEGRAAQVVQLRRDRLHVVAAQEGVHAPGRLLALGDGLDDGLRAEHGVAAGEDLGVGGLQRPVVDGERAPACVGEALGLAGAVEQGELADGADDLIALDDELRALHGHRAGGGRTRRARRAPCGSSRCR